MTEDPFSSIMPIDRVLDLYAEGIRRYGGTASNPKDGCLEGSIGNAGTSSYYRSMQEEPSAADDPNYLYFAAYALVYLVRNHCFTDGNKRVAWMVFVDILARKNLTVDASQDEAAQIVEDIANHICEFEDVMKWITENRLKPIH